MEIETKPNCWIVNDRYWIYKSDGCIYDNDKAEDIPQNLFALRDLLIKD